MQNATIRKFALATNGGDLLATFNLAVAARPQVSLGSEPPPPSQVSVPSFSALDIPDDFHLPVAVRVPFSLILDRARPAIVGTELPIKVIGTVRVDGVDMYATDSGTATAPQPKLVIEVDFSGGASGKLYLWGYADRRSGDASDLNARSAIHHRHEPALDTHVRSAADLELRRLSGAQCRDV